MKAALTLLTILAILTAFSTAFAADPPSLELTVKNIGKSQATISVSRAGMTESKNTVTKQAAAGGQVTFTREETAHDPSEKFPVGWDVYIDAPGLDNCHDVISLDKAQCDVQSGGCAQVDGCGQCCFAYTIKPE